MTIRYDGMVKERIGPMTDEEFEAFNRKWWANLEDTEREAFWLRLPYLVLGAAATVGLPLALLIVWLAG